MKRSIGVLLSAILIFFGCAVTLLLGGLAAVAMGMAPAGQASVLVVRFLILCDCVFSLGFAGWGIATGVGLLGLRNWARISVLVFSGLMAGFCLFSMILVPFMPVAQNESMPANFALIVHAILMTFYGFFVALGVFWLVYFNRSSVRTQFVAVASPPAVAVSPVGTSVERVPTQPKRPVFITVWSWLLIVSALFAPFVLVLHTPQIFFGDILVGRSTDLWASILAAAGLAAGIGMLKRQWWAWAVALCLQSIVILNLTYTLAVPDTMARYTEVVALQQSAMGFPNTTATVPPAFLEICVGFGGAFAIAVLAMLLVHRGAFSEEIPPPSAAI